MTGLQRSHSNFLEKKSMRISRALRLLLRLSNKVALVDGSGSGLGLLKEEHLNGLVHFRPNVAIGCSKQVGFQVSTVAFRSRQEKTSSLREVHYRLNRRPTPLRLHWQRQIEQQLGWTIEEIAQPPVWRGRLFKSTCRISSTTSWLRNKLRAITWWKRNRFALI